MWCANLFERRSRHRRGERGSASRAAPPRALSALLPLSLAGGALRMPKGHGWERRRKRVVKEVEQHESHIFCAPDDAPARPPRAGEDHDLGAPGGADYRMQCFALMAWLRDYRPLLQMESAADG